MATIKVAVLLAAFNGKRWLPEQVSTILQQKDVDVTIFVSVDKSSDGTESWFDYLAERESRIMLLSHGQCFGSAAANFLRLISEVDFSYFDYVSFADQDDMWNSDKLFQGTEILRQQKADAYSSNVIACWPDGRKVLVDKAQPQVDWDFLFESAGPGCTYIINKKLAVDFQGFVRYRYDEMSSVWLHDWLIYAFARSRGYKWVIDKNPSMLYRQHVDNSVGVNKGLVALLHRMHFVLSGRAIEQTLLLVRLCGLENSQFVCDFSKKSRLRGMYLAMNASKCRRKGVDRIYFVLSGILLTIVGSQK
ncbi:MAG: rhamnosyltransferase [Desulforhopalus sp.]|jgi:rhamnosyltransferase